MAQRDDWREALTPDDIAELDKAIEAAKRTGKSTGALTREDFPLPTLTHKIDRWREALSEGCGFQLVRGIPVDRWSHDVEIFFWCFGLHLGQPGAQNPDGDLLGHVRDTGADPEQERHYRTAVNINFHCDAADVVGLLCLNKAKSGGKSRIVSSVSIYNEFLRRRPDLVDRLYRPFQLDTHGEGGVYFMPIPPVCYADGRLRTFYHTDYFRSAATRPGAKPLSAEDRETLDLYNEIADSPDLYLDMSFEPGDIQLVSNHTLLHARTAYEDFDDPKQKRHLLRLWLSLPGGSTWRQRLLAQRTKATLVANLVRLRVKTALSV